jgi:RND family efflux transporter MFP subunit
MPWRFAAALLIVLGAGCGRTEPPAEAPAESEIAVPVAAQPATRGRLRLVVRATGVVTPAPGSEFVLVATEPGRIVEVPPAEGDRVARGDVLVRFDVPSAAAEASRHQADIARAQALLENARIAQARSRELLERGIISRREMENADREVENAQAEVLRAQSALRLSEASAARAIVRAPFAGVVAQRLHNPGDVVRGVATDPILRLVDPDRLEVTASIPAADAPRVLPGAAARVTSMVEPVVLTVASRNASSSGGDSAARLTFPPGVSLPVDTRVELEIDGEERVNVLLVPVDAVLRSANGAEVLVAVGERAQRRAITTGLADADSVEVVSGLNDGDLVITRGHTGLADGTPVSVSLTRP